MAVYLPIISEFKDAGIKNAVKSFKELETTGQKAAFLIRKAALPAAAAIAGMAGFLMKAAKGAEEARIAQRGLANVLTRMGYEKATDRVSAYAEELEKTLAIDADVIKRTQTKLATFKNLTATVDDAGGAFDRATMAALDLAAAGFGTAESNAVQLGKALQDPIKGIAALARAGVTFTAQEKEKIKALVESGDLLEAQNLILGAIETQVGGTAEETRSGFEAMQLAIARVSDVFGELMLPVLDEIIPRLEQFADWAEKNPDKFKAIALSIAGISGAVIALNIALALNPIVLLSAAIAGLVAAMLIAGPEIDAFFNNLKKQIDDVLGPFGVLLERFFALGSIVGGSVGGGGFSFSGVLSRMFGTAKSIIPGFGSLTGLIPGLADGGIVKARNGGTLALIGEGGRDEAVVPLGRNGSAFPTGGVTVNVSGALDPVAVARQIQQILDNRQSAFGF
jgi:hypothetical protein